MEDEGLSYSLKKPYKLYIIEVESIILIHHSFYSLDYYLYNEFLPLSKSMFI